MNPRRPHRRHNRPRPVSPAGPPRAGIVVAAAVAAALSGCVWHGEFVTTRVVAERHPLGAKQVVLTTSGQPAPPPQEVHHARLNHGAPRAHRPSGPVFPWWEPCTSSVWAYLVNRPPECAEEWCGDGFPAGPPPPPFADPAP
ncbi:hypothetical protein [Alienimonas sp. DA493]|uniref:hypothetical protein n=1 Tax=Alienimonas sp. DA493 TaxID=3373605 RepID=UPI00375536CB